MPKKLTPAELAREAKAAQEALAQEKRAERLAAAQIRAQQSRRIEGALPKEKSLAEIIQEAYAHWQPEALEAYDNGVSVMIPTPPTQEPSEYHLIFGEKGLEISSLIGSDFDIYKCGILVGLEAFSEGFNIAGPSSEEKTILAVLNHLLSDSQYKSKIESALSQGKICCNGLYVVNGQKGLELQASPKKSIKASPKKPINDDS